MRVFVSIVGLAACVMVAVGFKAKWSAAFLVIVLSIFNVFANNWWSVHSAHPTRDFLKCVGFSCTHEFPLRLVIDMISSRRFVCNIFPHLFLANVS